MDVEANDYINIESNEIYTLDISSNAEHIIMGGKDNCISILEFSSLDTIKTLESFKDSIIFCKFLNEGKFMVVTLDGLLEVYAIGQDIRKVYVKNIGEDISASFYKNKKIALGTHGGNIYCIRDNTEGMLFGHVSEILDLYLDESKCYSLSSECFLIHDLGDLSLVRKVSIRNIVNFYVTDYSNIIILGFEDNIRILKKYEILQRIDTKGKPLCYVQDKDNLFIGLDSSFLYIMKFKENLLSYYYECKDENIGIEGITRIKILHENYLVFSTLCGRIGFGDYREKESFTYQKVSDGVIISFKIVENIVYWYGESGFGVLELSLE